MVNNKLSDTTPVDKVQDPSPSKFKMQAIIVAVVLVILGALVFFLASALAGGVIALLGAVFGLGAQVARDLPIE